jgi:APA family basic amino acid/polyamine antiporter
VLTGMVPFREIDPTAPLASAFLARGLTAVAWIISAGAVAGLTSVLLVLLLGQSRIFFAVSRDGLLPPAFSKIHPRFRTPYIPTTATGIAVGITAALLPIEEIAQLTNIGTLLAPVPDPVGTGGAHNRDRVLSFFDGAPADSDLDQVRCVAGNWTGDLFHLWTLSQPRRP